MRQTPPAFIHREIVRLVVLIAFATGAFFATRRIAAANDALRLRDAREWYARGMAARRDGDLDTALAAFRRAVAKDPGAMRYGITLASTLMAANRDDQARQVLLELREAQPEDPDTNLQLARLEGRGVDDAVARRYYQTAIAALWTPAQRDARRQARTEFISFLLSHGERDRALSELLILESALPADPTSQLNAASMLLSAGDARRAVDHFGRALAQEPDNQAALAGAGEAAFEIGDYQHARQYFSRLESAPDRVRDLRQLADLVVARDPLASRLSGSERRQRLVAGLGRTIERLESCQAAALSARRDSGLTLSMPLDAARQFSSQLPAARPLSSDEIEAGFELIYRGERAAETACGPPEPFDRALLLIGRRHGLES